jgi:anti-sigma regulatory factor (Ser/Thr protein kinase)
MKRQVGQFVPRMESAVAARNFVRDAVRETNIDRDDAMLLTSELVNNAILHAHTAFEVRVDVADDNAVYVAVVNHAPEMLLVAREATAEGGRGLALIAHIANAWGFESHADTKLVWFQLAGHQAISR